MHTSTPTSRAVRKGKGKEKFCNAIETNVHGDALCFMAMGPPLLQRLPAGGWWWLAAVGGWRLVAVGSGWLLASVGSWRSLGAVLKGCPSQKKKTGFLKTALIYAYLHSCQGCAWKGLRQGGGGGLPSRLSGYAVWYFWVYLLCAF